MIDMINLTLTDREVLAVHTVVLNQDEYDDNTSIDGQLRHMHGNPERTTLRMKYEHAVWLENVLMDDRGERWGSNDVTDHVLGRLNKILTTTIKDKAAFLRIFEG